MDNLLHFFTLYSAENNFIFPILILVSFLAGILASLSPCSLGVLPLIVGYVGGYSKANNKKLFIQLFSFNQS